MQFIYKVRDRYGKLETGMIQAVSASEAGTILSSSGKYPVSLKAAKSGYTQIATKSRGRIKKVDVINFVHQLAIMVETGVPLSEAIDCVNEQIENESFKDVVNDIANRVNSGQELSKALSAYPKVFPHVMISLIKASEISGTMGIMLDRISIYMQKEQQTAKKIKGALIYPVFMIFTAIAVTVFLLVFVLPKFAGIYQSKGATLPLPTRLLMGASDLLLTHWVFCLIFVVLAAVTIVVSAKTSIGRRAIDYSKINMPIIGPLFSKLYITRSCRTMGTMLNAGVPILDMVDIAKVVTSNVLFEQLWDQVDHVLRRGAQLSDAMFESVLIPRSVSQMIYSGEKSGKLATVMERVAEYTEAEFDEQVKVTTQFIEPVMIAVMGGLIGFVAIALLLPIFSIGRVVSGS